MLREMDAFLILFFATGIVTIDTVLRMPPGGSAIGASGAVLESPSIARTMWGKNKRALDEGLPDDRPREADARTRVAAE